MNIKIKMKITPIREMIADKNNFVRVMPFLDNERVQQEILRIRNQIPNLKNPVPYDKYDQWFDYVTQNKETRQTHPLIWQLYLKECVNILEKFGRQDIHYHTFWRAIVCGEIKDEDCISVWVDIVYPGLRFSQIPRLVIVIQPQSTISEIKRALEERGSKQKILERYEQGEIGKGVIPYRLVGTNVNIKDLKKQRSLYLRHEPYIFGYQKIAYATGTKREGRSGLEAVRSPIGTYENRVRCSIRIPLASPHVNVLGK